MILLYHSIVPSDSPPEKWRAGQALTQTAFRRHMLWLADHCQIVSLSQYLELTQQSGSAKRQPVAITFDDGFDITFRSIFPVLSAMRIAATIFISTGHLENGELLWFSYLKALCFDSQYAAVKLDGEAFSLQTAEQRKLAWDQLRIRARNSGNPFVFSQSLSKQYPLDPAVKSFYAGMTHQQIRVAVDSGLLELGAHTITHPFLCQLSREQKEKEILGSKKKLSELAAKEISYFAYPSGEYDQDTLEIIKTSGFQAAFAVIPNRIGTDSRFEVSRIGIYSPSLLKLQMKIAGLADLGRFVGLKVG